MLGFTREELAKNHSVLRVRVEMNCIIIIIIIIIYTTGNSGGSCFYILFAFSSAKLFLLFREHKSTAELNGRLLI